MHFYLNDEGTEVSTVQVHRNAESMEAYLPLAQGLLQQALEVTTTTAVDAFGSPGPIAQQVLRANADKGAIVRISANRAAGFTSAAAP